MIFLEFIPQISVMDLSIAPSFFSTNTPDNHVENHVFQICFPSQVNTHIFYDLTVEQHNRDPSLGALRSI